MDLSGFTPEQLEKAAGMLKAMAHPVRISLISQLINNNKLSVTEMYEKLGIEQAVASHHLGILKNKGVLNSRREGKNTYYSLRHDTISSVVDCISKCACS